MGINEIARKIISDAEKEAERIKEGYALQAEEMQKKMAEESENQCNQLLKKAKKEAQESAERIKISARLESRKKLLQEKQEAISYLFTLLSKKLVGLSREEYRHFFKEMLLNSLESGDEEIILSLDEKRLDKAFVQEINEGLRRQGKNGNLKISEEKRDIHAGFILRKGKIEINNSLSVLLQSWRNSEESEIIRILFG